MPSRIPPRGRNSGWPDKIINMKKEELLCYLGFSHFLGIGPIKFSLLKKHFGSTKKAYFADRNILNKLIGQKLTAKFIDFRNEFDPVKKIRELEKKDIKIITIDDDNYPLSLKNIPDPPICIYLKGEIPHFFKMSNKSTPILFAIVGTRSPTHYGIEITKIFSYRLAKAGFIIVSGLANGVDTVAHRYCLNAKGRTVAVLGCGVDIVYPASNRYLYNEIISSGGAIISEFPPGQLVQKGLFIARNRIISALSQGVMVVEGSEDSGSLITARYAAEQGKDVFAPPSPITSKMSLAPNLLLKQGAKLVTSAEDILDEYNVKITFKNIEEIKSKLNTDEKKFFELLEKKPLRIDDISLSLKEPVSKVLNIVSIMEIKGIIDRNSDNQYQIKAA